jgi:type III pantothenate kinase
MPFQLAIDRGNTRTKLSVSSSSGIIEEHFSLTDDFLDQELIRIAEKYEITRCILSDVRGNDFTLPAQWKCVTISNQLKFPFLNAYGTPETVGHDRLANMAGATTLFPGENIVVIDCGTCITYSLLIENTFLGGSIAPGIQMRYKALHHFTGKLPEIEKLGKLPATIGKTTEDSIHSGVEFAVIAETRGMIDAYQHEFGKLKVVLTGGDYSFFEEYIKSATFASALLTQIGLHEILRINNV